MLGGQFLVLADRLPISQVVLGLIGFSDQTWNGMTLPLPLPLPLPLQAIGAPGCSLLAAPKSTLFLGLSSSNGTATWATAIPADQTLAGLEFFQQVACTAPTANALGLVRSNGCHGSIGN